MSLFKKDVDNFELEHKTCYFWGRRCSTPLRSEIRTSRPHFFFWGFCLFLFYFLWRPCFLFFICFVLFCFVLFFFSGSGVPALPWISKVWQWDCDRMHRTGQILIHLSLVFLLGQLEGILTMVVVIFRFLFCIFQGYSGAWDIQKLANFRRSIFLFYKQV